MKRSQIQLPDELYREAKRIAAEQEMTLAEVIRRGIEQAIRMYPPRDPVGQWRPPAPANLGAFAAPRESWRGLADE